MKKAAAALAIMLASTTVNAGMIAERIERIDNTNLLMTNLFSDAGRSDICPAGSYEARLIVNDVTTWQVYPYGVGCWNFLDSGEVAVIVHPLSGGEPFVRGYQAAQFKKLEGMTDWGKFTPTSAQ